MCEANRMLCFVSIHMRMKKASKGREKMEEGFVRPKARRAFVSLWLWKSMMKFLYVWLCLTAVSLETLALGVDCLAFRHLSRNHHLRHLDSPLFVVARWTRISILHHPAFVDSDLHLFHFPFAELLVALSSLLSEASRITHTPSSYHNHRQVAALFAARLSFAAPFWRSSDNPSSAHRYFC